MKKPVERYHVNALKRNSQQVWTLFDNITEDEMAIALPAGQFDYAVIYDRQNNKIGYWNKEKGICFHNTKKEIL